jgi:PAS domain S-box-containing protein
MTTDDPKYENLKREKEQLEKQLRALQDYKQRLRENKELFEKTFHSQRDAIFILDAEVPPRIIDCNPSATRIFGYSREEMLGKTTTFLHVDENSLSEFQKEIYFDIARQDHSHIENFHMKRKDESVFSTEHSIMPLKNEQNERIGWVSVVRDVTDRRQTEEALKRESEERRILLDNIPTQVWYLTDARTYGPVNKAHADFNGTTTEELSFQDLYDVYPEAVAEVCRQGNQEVFTSGKALQTEEWVPDGDNEQRLLSITKYPKLDENGRVEYVVCSAEDITRQNQTRIALEESEERYKNLVEKAGIGVLIDDQEGNFRYFNNKLADLFGYSSEELSGASIHTIVHPDEVDRVMKIHTARIQGKDVPSTYEFTGIRKDGSVIYLEVDAVELKDGEKITGTRSYFWDITNRKQAEEELKTAKEKAEESDRLKSAFLANMSHEIRTPLNAIMGFTQLMNNKSVSPEKQQNYLNIIQNRSHLLLQLINDIIDLSKIDANQIKLEKQTFSLNKLLSEIYSSFQMRLEYEGKSHLGFQLDKGVDDSQSFIYSDYSRLEQIFSNLLSNALKFTEEGSIRFGYKRSGKADLLFYVEDTGVGIAKDDQERIFDRFSQADESLAKKFGGTGLGLAISKSLIELLGGEIWVESRKHQGSTFYFTLPYHQRKPADAQAQAAESGTDDTWKDKTILIIEDDYSSLQLMKEILEPTGVILFLCETGNEGLEAFREHDGIDMILIDIKLPDMNGLELARKIRELTPEKKVTIIAQTAYAMYGDDRKSLEAGCDDYISKPVDTRKLLAKISKYF